MAKPRLSPESRGFESPFTPMATLIVTRENTIEIHKLVDQELIRLLPNTKSVIIPRAGHGSPRENSPAFNDAVLALGRKNGKLIKRIRSLVRGGPSFEESVP